MLYKDTKNVETCINFLVDDVNSENVPDKMIQWICLVNSFQNFHFLSFLWAFGIQKTTKVYIYIYLITAIDGL